MPTVISLLLLAAAVDGATIDVDERSTAVVVVVAPSRGTGGGGVVRTSALIDALAAEIEAATDLDVKSAEQAGITAAAFGRCPRESRFSCWVRTVRPAGSRGRRGPVALFALIARPAPEGATSMSLAVLDLEQALEELEASGGAEETEDALFALATRTSRSMATARDPESLAALFRRWTQQDLRQAMLRYRGRRGTIELQAPRDLGIALDGGPIGTTGEGGTTVRKLQPGLRLVRLSDRGQVVFTASVAVAAGEATIVAVPDLGEPTTHPARAPILWGGVALIVAGVALGAAAIATGDPEVDAQCLRRTGDGECRSPGLTGFSPSASAAPTGDPDAIDDSPVAAGPLAGALLITGAGATLGALLQDRREAPWIGLVVGAVVGAIGYGVAVAVDD